MNLPTFSIRNLTRRPLRSALTIGGIAIAVAGFVALLGLSRGVASAWQDSLDERGSHLVAFERDAVDFLTGSLPVDLVPKIRAIPGVRAVAAELVKLTPVDDSAHILAVGWAADAYLWRRIDLVAGRVPRPGANEVVLGRALGKKPGETISLLYDRFTVVGISGLAGMLNSRVAYFDLGRLQALIDRPQSTTMINVALDAPGDRRAVARIKARIAALSPRLGVLELAELVRNNRVLKLLRAIAWATSAIALAVGLLAVLNTMFMSLAERRGEMALLVTLGWPAHRIARLIIVEGLALAATGAVLGAAIGWLAARMLARLPGLQGFLTPDLTVGLVVEIVVAMIVLGVLGALLPAMRAARSDPELLLRTH